MNSAPTDPHQLLTVQQTADVLRISPSSVWRLIRENKLRARRIRSSTRIKRKDVDDFSDES